ncbi:hypothetical protein OJF2_37810 [Aquisphaera giovannonii]|uniref:SAP domain-containing protein n=1 Tax=Aquisphaera giovannonii TaxID=406548 RepID=A0A5B9W4T6_9BACT|nr:hypothetical protein [Aquisphaera giovannonii]QEH35234.1 hypothetical protein OJF2_37810 [Aquisphaera giovannonii]
MSMPLDLAGHLAILNGGDAVAVEFRGGVIDLRFSGLRQALRLRGRFGRARRRDLLRRLREALGRADVELHVWVGGRRVGRLAGDSRATRLAAWLGVDPLEVGIWGVRPVRRRGAGG